MSGNYYYEDQEEEDQEEEEEEEQDIRAAYQVNYPQYTTSSVYPGYTVPLQMPVQAPLRYSINPQQTIPQNPYMNVQGLASHPAWNMAASYTTSIQQPITTLPLQQVRQQPTTTPSYNYVSYATQGSTVIPQYPQTLSMAYQQMPAVASPSTYLSPPVIAGPSRPRLERTSSVASHASSVSYNTDNSRSESPNAAEMARWGTRNPDGSWSCSYPKCTSSSVFRRGCDLRKHYKRHSKTLFCRHENCPQATRGGFSSQKDRLRHEAKHNPEVLCEWEGCDRVFSRVDNMKDHVKRVHRKSSKKG